MRVIPNIGTDYNSIYFLVLWMVSGNFFKHGASFGPFGHFWAKMARFVQRWPWLAKVQKPEYILPKTIPVKSVEATITQVVITFGNVKRIVTMPISEEIFNYVLF